MDIDFRLNFCVSKLYSIWSLIGMVIWKYGFLTVANKDIILGYTAMLASDSSTKSALVLPHIRVGVPYTDFKCVISQYSFSTWQDDWNGMVANKLHSVKPVLGDWQSSYRQCKKDEIVLSCLHWSYTDPFVHLEERSPPQCILIVRHILWSSVTLLRQGKIYLVGMTFKKKNWLKLNLV